MLDSTRIYYWHFFYRNTCLRASNLLISATRFFKSLQSNCLYPDVYHMNPSKTRNDKYWNKVKWMPKMFATPLSASMQVFPLDMSQFPHLFQSTRIPMPDRDEIQRFPESRHILILHRGRFYTFDVLDQNGNIFESNYYLSSIDYILKVHTSVFFYYRIIYKYIYLPTNTKGLC